MTEEKLTPSQKYYRKNKDALNEQKRIRYKEDPDYRMRALERSKEQAIRKKFNSPKKTRKHRGPKQPKKYTLTIDGLKIDVVMYSIGHLATALQRRFPTIRKWEKEGLIPKALYRTKGGQRLYTEFQIDQIKKEYMRVLRKYGYSVVLNRIKKTDFFDSLKRIWEDYPAGVDLLKCK